MKNSKFIEELDWQFHATSIHQLRGNIMLLCYECILRVLKSSKTNITENNDENNTEV